MVHAGRRCGATQHAKSPRASRLSLQNTRLPLPQTHVSHDQGVGRLRVGPPQHHSHDFYRLAPCSHPLFHPRVCVHKLAKKDMATEGSIMAKNKIRTPSVIIHHRTGILREGQATIIAVPWTGRRRTRFKCRWSDGVQNLQACSAYIPGSTCSLKQSWIRVKERDNVSQTTSTLQSVAG